MFVLIVFGRKKELRRNFVGMSPHAFRKDVLLSEAHKKKERKKRERKKARKGMKESNPLSKKGRKRRGRTNFSHSSYYNVLRATKGELEARSRN